MDDERLWKIAKYIFIIGALSSGFMLLNTYLHNSLGTKLPDASEFMKPSEQKIEK